jgi:hypothetical protein
MRFFRRGFQTIAFPLGREIPLVGEEHVRESLSVQLRKVGIEGIERQILVLRLFLSSACPSATLQYPFQAPKLQG